MPSGESHLRKGDPAVEIFLLGRIDFDACLALQQRLVYEAGGRRDGQIALLICEHSPLITIGRAGSRAHLHVSQRELTNRGIDTRWVNRGGGCILHLPGQLAIYPIVPLDWHGLSVGQYLRRLEAALLAVVADCGVQAQLVEGGYGLQARTGQVASFGVAVKNWITYYGAYLNVAPASRLFRFIEADPLHRLSQSSLSTERQKPVKMASVRSSIIQRVTDAFGCSRHHIYTGHPLLAPAPQPSYESTPV